MKISIAVAACLLVLYIQLGAVVIPATTSTWNQPGSGCTGTLSCTYTIYRGPDTGQETLLKAGITGLQYVDSPVVRGSKYCYQVSASNQYGEGARSTERCLTIPNVPSTPGLFKVTSN